MMCDQTKRNRDGEKDLCVQLLLISIRDCIDSDEVKRRNAIRWFRDKNGDGGFSFNNVCAYIFGNDINVDYVRDRILKKCEDNKNGKTNPDNLFFM